MHRRKPCWHLECMQPRQLQQLQPRLRPPCVCCFHPLCCSSHAVLRTLSSPVLCCERVRAQHAVVAIGLPKFKSHSKVNADHAFFSVFDRFIVFLLLPVDICIRTQVAIQMHNACILRPALCASNHLTNMTALKLAMYQQSKRSLERYRLRSHLLAGVVHLQVDSLF